MFAHLYKAKGGGWELLISPRQRITPVSLQDAIVITLRCSRDPEWANWNQRAALAALEIIGREADEAARRALKE